MVKTKKKTKKKKRGKTQNLFHHIPIEKQMYIQTKTPGHK